MDLSKISSYSLLFRKKEIKNKIRNNKKNRSMCYERTKENKKRRNNSIDLKKEDNKRINLYNKLLVILPFYNIKYEDLKYDINDIIYYNEESIIYKGKYFHNEVSIKEIRIKEDEKILNEIEISIKLHHKNIINTIGYSFNKTKIYVISEYMKNKSLKLYIEKNKGKIDIKKK